MVQKDKIRAETGKKDLLTSYNDANWGNQFRKGRGNRSGTLVRYDDAGLAATTNPYKWVSLCSIEAEYVMLAEVINATIWLRSVLNELDVKKKESTVFKENNRCIERATGWAAKHFNKWQHMDAKQNFVVSALKYSVICLVPVNEMKADLLAKALSAIGLESAITVLNMSSHLTSNCWWERKNILR